LSGKLVAPVAAALAALIGGSHSAAEKTAPTVRQSTSRQTERVIGHGQIRYKGAGPEKWAFRFHREQRLVERLRRQFAARLDRLVYLVQAFECIHSHEASAWSTSTGNGYYGGLQFSSTAWNRYGSRFSARADLASPAQQIAAAIEYETVSGFWPWPRTGKLCGLP
jgi:hypothetical protein